VAEEHITSAIESLNENQLRRLERLSELGKDFHFGRATEKLRAIRDILVAFSEEPDDGLYLPTGVESNVINQAGAIQAIVDEMLAFSPGAIDSPRGVHEGIENRVEQLREWFVKEVSPYLRGRQLSTTLSIAEIEAERERIATAAAEIEHLLTKAREQAGEAATGRMSTFHEHRATAYKKQALWNLGGVVVSATALGVLGIIVFVATPPHTNTVASDWQPFIAGLIVRLFFLGLLSYALAFCARNYRVSRHLEVTHEQRRVALDTYPLLIQAIYDDLSDIGGSGAPETRNIVTAELARAAFAAIDSGFLHPEKEHAVIDSQPSLTAAIAALRR
jgi:hypothetical protein